MGTLESLPLFLPELALAATLLALVAADLLTSRSPLGRRTDVAATLALVGGAVALVLTIGLPAGVRGQAAGLVPTFLFDGMVALDAFAVFFKVLLGLSLLAAVAMSLGSEELRDNPNPGEYYAILVGATLGMFLMAIAANLLMAYLALEFVSLSSYVLTGYLKRDRRSSEAALKYLIYGGVASGAMIYGMSWIYGLTGAMDYPRIATGLAALDPASQGALAVALLLVLAGLGYKIAVVPFHMWAPDVYTGAPLPVTTFLAVGSKAAGFALMLRFFHFGVTAEGPAAVVGATPVPLLLGIVCAVTMTFGNLAALGQQNVKRLLAYSSISHAGYGLLGVVVFSDAGIEAVLFYLAVYYLMNLGAFWIALLVVNTSGREDLDAFRGLAWRGGAAPAVFMTIFLFSLAGLPPFAGFVGKFKVFWAGIQGGEYALVLIGALNSVISLYYYARIVRRMFLVEPQKQDPPWRVPLTELGAPATLAALTVLLGIGFEWLSKQAGAASRIFTG
jgi:NADH-quinone oxidoreductase subunit N